MDPKTHPADQRPMRKINVVGTSGSGKSTLGKAIAQHFGYPFIELDALFWRPDWEGTPDAEFFPKVVAALDQECWVLDGNYTRTIPLKWKEVDTVIWIDLSLARTLYQVTRRTIGRLRSGTEIWPGTGNRQSLRTFFSLDSVILWSLKGYFPTRAKYRRMMKDPQYKHIRFIHLKGPKAVRRFSQSLTSA